jgi:hypothetical protein
MGISVRVVTFAQFRTLAQHVASEAILDAALASSPAPPAELKQRGADPDLLVILRRALGTAGDVTVALDDRVTGPVRRHSSQALDGTPRTLARRQ